MRKARVRRDDPVQQTSRGATPTPESSNALVLPSGSNTERSFSEGPTLSHQTLSVSFSDQATCFFFYNFVVVNLGFSRGHLDAIPILIQRPGNGALVATVISVGMAALSNTKAAPQVMVAARQSYVKALRLINTALRDPVESKTDQTLSAILLLGLFEVSRAARNVQKQTGAHIDQIITCNSEQSMESWTNHIDGAAALLRFRGPEQLRTRTGFALFMHCRYQIVCTFLSLEIRMALMPGSLSVAFNDE